MGTVGPICKLCIRAKLLVVTVIPFLGCVSLYLSLTGSVNFSYLLFLSVLPPD